MEKANPKKTGHLSLAQKQKLLDIMREQPLLRNGKFSQNFTHKNAQKEWEDISNTLNCIPGSHKDWRLWRKTWHDLQSKAKIKKADFKKSTNKTGGGPPPESLTDFEEGVVSLINSNSIEGHEGVSESVVMFETDDLINNTLQNENLLDVPILPPPPEFFQQNLEEAEGPGPENHQEQGGNGANTKKKINMKTLLKEKIELKNKIVASTIQFQRDFIKIQEERNKILRDLTAKLNERNNE